jgi:hypothetical protein
VGWSRSSRSPPISDDEEPTAADPVAALCRLMGLIRRLFRELVERADRLNAHGASVGELAAGEGGAPGIQSEA